MLKFERLIVFFQFAYINSVCVERTWKHLTDDVFSSVTDCAFIARLVLFNAV